MDPSRDGPGGWTVPGFSTVGELGSGASGRVVVAVQDGTGRRVAIKYLVPRLAGDETFVARFRAEARLLSMLRDPHVVQLYEYVETLWAAAIVMELIDGVALSKLIAQYGPTSPEAALSVLHGSLAGLSAAHRLGVVHRDYKPDNILVRPDGTSLLADFGVAAAGGSQGGVAGTPAYMAPEQWQGRVGTPADVYAATVVFFECLTGHRPFTGQTVPELADAHALAPIPVEQVPEPLRSLLAHGMAKDPAQRPLTAEVFAAELEQVAGSAYGPDWAERGRRALGALVGLTPVALLLGGSLGGLGSAGASGTGATAGSTSFATSTLGVSVLATAGLVVIAGGVAIAVQATNSSRPAHVTSPIAQPPSLTGPPSKTITPSSSSPSPITEPSPNSDTSQASVPPSTEHGGPPSPNSPSPKSTTHLTSTSAMFTVSSTEGWQRTSVHLTGGQRFTIQYVSGSWTVDYRNFPYVGPGGYSNEEDAKIYQGCKFDGNNNYGVLYGDVGETPNGAFPIGNGGSFTAVPPSAYVNGGGNNAYLYLRINDTCLTDNAGSVTMRVTTTSSIGAH